MRFILFITLLFPFTVKAQEYTGTEPITTAANLLYVELFGPASVYSINYERRLIELPTAGLSTRLGAGYLPAPNELGLVGGIYFISGREIIHFETGLGLSNIIELNTNEIDLLLHGNLGFRVQPLEGGISMRVNYYPLYSLVEGRFRNWGGFSIGYAF